MRKLFGTDGIRAVAGQPPLDPSTVYATGLALAWQLSKQQGEPARIVLGMDTRLSSPNIAAQLVAGLTAGGAVVENAGVIPTPAIAYLVRRFGFSAGVVISASHNPWQDNGIKIFGGDGYKLPDSTELEIEAAIFHQLETAFLVPPDLATPTVNTHYADEYIQFLLDAVPGIWLSGMMLAIDCANGAASAIAPRLFSALGANFSMSHASPNGRNINLECGALYPQTVALETVESGAALGITFDGDADRALFANSHGKVLNGDAVLLMAGRDMQHRKLLHGDTVVATTMSNMGLEAAFGRNNIRMLRAPVGDKYVLEQMQVSHASLGGEQSGHILFPHLATTGDGLLTALVVLDLIHRSGKTVEELTADLKVFPQVIVNVHVREKRPLESLPEVQQLIHRAELELANTGRVVIRYSGTEALARVMIEAESEDAMTHHATAIAEAIRSAIGA